MNDEQCVLESAPPAQEDALEETLEATANDSVAEEAERFRLNGELFEDEGSKEFKDLVESFVNDHGLPQNKVEALIALVERGASQGQDEFAKASESLKQEAIKEFQDQAQTLSNEEFMNWASELSGEEELTNIKMFALKRIGDSCTDEQKAQLLNSTPFLKYMHQERNNLSNNAPSVFSAQKKVSEKEAAQQDFYNALMGYST